MFGLLQKLFFKAIGGTRNERLVRTRMEYVLEKVNPLEAKFQGLTDEQLREYSDSLRQRLQAGESRNAIRPEAFALIREASKRARNHRQFDVQLIAGQVLDEGMIAEEATGEGKTVACYPAIYMSALEGLHSHVVTTNDYLVQRDAEFARPVFELLGFSVGFIRQGMATEDRKAAYACNVTYGTNSEFGFDYLRDNMKLSASEQVQGSLDFAIVDEVDSILIDEARTPLIISGPSTGQTDRYRKADTVARELIQRNRPWDQANHRAEAIKREIKSLVGEQDKKKGDEKVQNQLSKARQELAEAEDELANCTKLYEVELDKKSVHMTDEGVGVAQEVAAVGSFYVGANMEWPHLMEQALRAHLAFERDKDYVVQEGEVIIVDEFTGRLMVGREWSDGLHQAVCAKERVAVKEENQTLATITLQNYFKLYKKLAGMTGTAMTEANEFMKIYGLDVVAVPTNKPVCREDREDRIYATEDAKFDAIVEEIREVAMAGRPVLVGTTSIEKSERISERLARRYGVEHEVLNGRAENAAREKDIVAKAGHQHLLKKGSDQMVGNVTIATNMAGRGTDIKLGEGVVELGGLHIIGTERHEARRIDNQLRGRAGRQGDPGSSRFFVSLRDDLMAVFAGEWTLKVLGWLGLQGDAVIEDRRISKGIERAQKKVEERNFEIRKNLLDYDEVMDFQRHHFYSRRQKILEGRELDGLVMEMVRNVVDEAVDSYLGGGYRQRCIAEWARQTLQIPIRDDQIRAENPDDQAGLERTLRGRAKDEANSVISITLGEYMDEDVDSREWDLRGLSNWAMSRFRVSISQNQLRKMTVDEVEKELFDAACQRIDKADLSPLGRYLESDFPIVSLCQWAEAKFAIELGSGELSGQDTDQIRQTILDSVMKLYSQREIEYPVEYALEMTIGHGGPDNVYALAQLAEWANRKYQAELTSDILQTKKPQEIYRELVDLSRQWQAGERLDACIKEGLGSDPTAEQACDFVSSRFDTKLSPADLNGDIVASVRDIGRRFLRREMTELERFVLLQIYDSSWKDHLLSMDHLKSGIGLRGFAEQDPRVAYKREGAKQFDEMLAGVQDKVTDMIFKVRIAAGEEMSSVYQISGTVHDQLSAYDGIAQDMEQQQAAAQGRPAKVETITRDIPKVGRNEPCPCGSGKKYKKCCGRLD